VGPTLHVQGKPHGSLFGEKGFLFLVFFLLSGIFLVFGKDILSL
jgi:hypothetical protein